MLVFTKHDEFIRSKGACFRASAEYLSCKDNQGYLSPGSTTPNGCHHAISQLVFSCSIVDQSGVWLTNQIGPFNSSGGDWIYCFYDVVAHVNEIANSLLARDKNFAGILDAADKIVAYPPLHYHHGGTTFGWFSGFRPGFLGDDECVGASGTSCLFHYWEPFTWPALVLNHSIAMVSDALVNDVRPRGANEISWFLTFSAHFRHMTERTLCTGTELSNFRLFNPGNPRAKIDTTYVVPHGESFAFYTARSPASGRIIGRFVKFHAHKSVFTKASLFKATAANLGIHRACIPQHVCESTMTNECSMPTARKLTETYQHALICTATGSVAYIEGKAYDRRSIMKCVDVHVHEGEPLTSISWNLNHGNNSFTQHAQWHFPYLSDRGCFEYTRTSVGIPSLTPVNMTSSLRYSCPLSPLLNRSSMRDLYLMKTSHTLHGMFVSCSMMITLVIAGVTRYWSVRSVRIL